MKKFFYKVGSFLVGIAGVLLLAMSFVRMFVPGMAMIQSTRMPEVEPAEVITVYKDGCLIKHLSFKNGSLETGDTSLIQRYQLLNGEKLTVEEFFRMEAAMAEVVVADE